MLIQKKYAHFKYKMHITRYIIIYTFMLYTYENAYINNFLCELGQSLFGFISQKIYITKQRGAMHALLLYSTMYAIVLSPWVLLSVITELLATLKLNEHSNINSNYKLVFLQTHTKDGLIAIYSQQIQQILCTQLSKATYEESSQK